ncbi:unnamed protein product, partial [Urochloa humidicola]
SLREAQPIRLLSLPLASIEPTLAASLLSLSPSTSAGQHGVAAPSGATGIRSRWRRGHGASADSRAAAQAVPAGKPNRQR